MANPKHIALVRKGTEAIVRWRLARPGERFDLSGTDLSEIWLSGANLSDADLSGTDLSGARLHSADLSGANLNGANLSGANLFSANLVDADLRGAWLASTDLSWANLSLATLRGAILSKADLTGAIVSGVSLSKAKLSLATLGYTSLNDLNLSRVIGLPDVVHKSPSSVGVDTLIASFRGARNKLTPALRTFFGGAGVPQELLDTLPLIVAAAKYYSCFISYGQPDLDLATKLDKGLRAKGVSCWTYEMDKTPGERTWQEIGTRRREADKMVLLCSGAALVRDGILKEIEEQIDEDPDKMVPISLDDLWKEPGFRVMRGTRDLKPFLLDRNYADFPNKPYEEALEELLKGLRRPPMK